MKFIKFILLLVFAGTVSSVSAGILPEKERGDLINQVLQHFWGNAKLPDGTLIQPKSEAERRTVPVSAELAHRALDAGEVSGLAEWCRLDWESHFLSFTRAARRKGMSEKQVAFVSFVHGAAQGRVFDAMEKSGACNTQDKSKIERMLNQSKANH